MKKNHLTFKILFLIVLNDIVDTILIALSNGF